MPSKEESKNNVGCPLKYKDKKALEAKFEEYKKNREAKELPLTKSSFLLYAGFYDPNALKTYVNDKNKEEFSTTIKRIELEILSSKHDNGYKNPTAFAMFDLKVNHGWVETKHVVVEDKSDLVSRLELAKKRTEA